MPPKKDWEEESSDEESSSASETPQITAGVPRRKFDDEEGEDSDVLDSWDAAEDSEVEREKAKKAAEAKAKAEAEAKAAKKSKAERIALHQAERKAAKAARVGRGSDSDSDSEGETEQQKKDRLLRAQKEADLKHAEDLFAGVGVISSRKGNTAAAAVIVDPSNPNHTIDLGDLPLFNPRTKTQLDNLGKTIGPLLGQNHKMPHYVMFFQELCKTLAKELPSDQVKKVASSLTAVSNEKMKAEKAGDKTGKKKGKAKTTLVTTRSAVDEDAAVYHEGDGAFGDDDFM